MIRTARFSPRSRITSTAVWPSETAASLSNGHLGARHPLEIFQGEDGQVGHGSKPTPAAVR